jgi:hypothetical protein
MFPCVVSWHNSVSIIAVVEIAPENNFVVVDRFCCSGIWTALLPQFRELVWNSREASY